MILSKLGGKPCLAVLFFVLLLHHNCKANDEDSLLPDDIFTKPNPPTLSPDAFVASPPPVFAPSPLPTDTPAIALATSVGFDGRDGCLFARDIYCIEITQEAIDESVNKNSSEIEELITRNMVEELGISYRPLISGNVEYWSQNSTTGENDRSTRWTGFTFTDSEENEGEKFRVDAYALGVIISSLSNIDSVQGLFDVKLKLFFFNITEGPFSTVADAVDTIYKDDSKTTVTDSKYYRLNDHDLPGAWSGRKTEGGEDVHPDGLCTPRVLASMQPIPMEKFDRDLLRLPRLNSRIFPEFVQDGDGMLSHVELMASFKFKPLNRKFYPVQIDLLDIFFDMGSSNLIDEDQLIVKNLLCLHPSYSGFDSHVFGADADAGHSTSDSVTMVPYIFFDRIEPWFQPDLPQFHYGAERQRSNIGNGSNLQRMLGLRIIVEHPTGKGWFEILPILFISITAVANFVSIDPHHVGASSMIQALLGVNSLVTQNTQYIGPHTVMGQSLLLAYAISGLWVFTIVLMILINQAKRGEDGENKWYIIYQNKIFRYLRLLAGSLCFLYIPFISAYYIDKNNGSQTSMAWVWVLIVGLIVSVFVARAVKDYRKIRKKKRERRAQTIQAFADITKFSSKPLNQWNEDEVLRWITIGSMQRDSYFSEAKRSSIAEKLKSACVDGELLCRFGTDIDKLVQFIGLPFGDAVKLSEEFKLLAQSNKEWAASVEFKNG